MKVRFNLNPKGHLKLYNFPEIGDSYVIGGDVGDGVQGGDPSCAQVISVRKFKQVAVWHGLCEPYDFGAELWALGYYYNTALLMPEVNASGASSLAYLTKNEYPNIYRTKILDGAFPEETERMGWRTNLHTRRLMLDMLRSSVKENSLIIQDSETLDEMKVFVKNKDSGKMEASPGNHDDRVMALAIAVFGVLENQVSSYAATTQEDDFLERIRRQRGLDSPGIPLGRGGY